MKVKVIIEHEGHLTSEESYRAIPEDPEKWTEEHDTAPLFQDAEVSS